MSDLYNLYLANFLVISPFQWKSMLAFLLELCVCKSGIWTSLSLHSYVWLPRLEAYVLSPTVICD